MGIKWSKISSRWGLGESTMFEGKKYFLSDFVGPSTFVIYEGKEWLIEAWKEDTPVGAIGYFRDPKNEDRLKMVKRSEVELL